MNQYPAQVAAREMVPDAIMIKYLPSPKTNEYLYGSY